MKAPVHTQITLVSFLAPTNTKGARIHLEDGTTGHTVIIPYDYTQNTAEKGALAWFAERGVHPIGRASSGRGEKAILIHAPEDSSAVFSLFVKRP